MKRREFLTLPVEALGGTLLLSVARLPIPLRIADGTVRVPLRFFTAAEARVVTAVCERIFPADESGPGATQAGVVVYIDRQLAGPYGRDKYRYVKGPFVDAAPEQGYQAKPSPREVYRTGIRDLGDFASLSADDQIVKLHAIEKTRFFELVRTHTIEGVFCDPMHGGNVGLAGWKMIGYPGPQMNYRAHIDAHYGDAFRPAPASLRQVTGQPGHPLEEEPS